MLPDTIELHAFTCLAIVSFDQLASIFSDSDVPPDISQMLGFLAAAFTVSTTVFQCGISKPIIFFPVEGLKQMPFSPANVEPA